MAGQVDENHRQNEKLFKYIFEESPVSLWVEDFSGIKQYLEELKKAGLNINSLNAHEKKEISRNCLKKIKIIEVNKAALALYEAESKDQLINNLHNTFLEDSYDSFMQEVIALSKGLLKFENEANAVSLRGTKRNVMVRWDLTPEYAETWERIIVSVIDITTRKEIEDALAKKEENLRLVLHQVPATLYTLDKNLLFTTIYGGNLDNLGLKAEDFIGKPMGPYPPGHPDETLVINYHARALTGETVQFSAEWRDRTYLSRLEPLRNAQNEIIGVLGITIDITERQLTDMAIKQRDAHLQLILNQMPGAFYTTDLDLHYTSMFSGNLAGYSMPAADFIGKSVGTFPNGYSDAWQVTDYHCQGVVGEAVTFDANFRDRVHMFHLEPMRDEKRTIVGVLGIIFDVTQRVQAEKELKQSKEQLALMLNQIPGAIYTTDANLHFTSMYSATLAGVGLRPEEFIGQPAGLFPSGHDDEKVIDNYHRQALAGQDVDYDSHFRGRAYNSHLEPLRDSENNIIGVVAIVLDITDRERAEEERLQISRERQAILEKTLKISELKANIITQATHELKTPLTSIYGWASLLNDPNPRTKESIIQYEKEGLESILHNAQRMINLINDFLDIGNIESGKVSLNRKMIDVPMVLEDAIHAVSYYAIQKGIQIKTELCHLPKISLDRQRIEQVLTNLLLNSIKYSPNGTRVTIRSSIISFSESNSLSLIISDEGYGFTSDELSEAFTPFGKAYTQQPQKKGIQGTGLGLFISRGIIVQHGGTLTIHSKGANQGTNVEILLPINHDSTKND